MQWVVARMWPSLNVIFLFFLSRRDKKKWRMPLKLPSLTTINTDLWMAILKFLDRGLSMVSSKHTELRLPCEVRLCEWVSVTEIYWGVKYWKQEWPEPTCFPGFPPQFVQLPGGGKALGEACGAEERPTTYSWFTGPFLAFTSHSSHMWAEVDWY